MTRDIVAVGFAGLLLVGLAGASPLPALVDDELASPSVLAPIPMCSGAAAPEYYAFPLVTTGRVPGTGAARGVAETLFADSPFGISLSPDGSYVHRVELRMERFKKPRRGTYVVWFTTTEIDQIVNAGELTDPESFGADVAWNKFLVVITLEEAFDPDATVWSGPVAFRGMSRSGMMHTMAGHGPFEEEKCAAYGY